MKITLKAEGKDITLDCAQLKAFNLLEDIKNNIFKRSNSSFLKN